MSLIATRLPNRTAPAFSPSGSGRIRLNNEKVSLAFDGWTGELVELTNNTTGENLLKNRSPLHNMPFNLELTDRSGDKHRVLAPNYHQIRKDLSLRPTFTRSSPLDSEESLSIRYGSLSLSNGTPVPVRVTVCITLRPDDCETLWTLNLDYLKDGGEEDCRVNSVQFPCLAGIFHGKSWKDDTLVYPVNSGEKTHNPVETYAQRPARIRWKWQQYQYEYHRDGIPTTRDESGAYYREFRYSGPLSMMWLDYYDANQGLYLASYDEKTRVAAIRVETFGPESPGMGFCITRYPNLKPGESWKSSSCGIAIHPGDWHWGADRYRSRIETCRSASTGRPTPKWFKESAGLVAHYDFKYQNGDIVHRFSDLPRLYKEARDLGLNHLLLSGWHIDGFDNGFPMYRPDPDLGTPEELAAHIRAIKQDGGHVGFYVNSRLVNRRYAHLHSLIKEAAAHPYPAEKKAIESYGDNQIHFAVMSPNSTAWRERILDAIRFLVNQADADSIYLDQLAMAAPVLGYTDHNNPCLDAWNEGYRRLLEDINIEFDIALLYEGCSDIHGHQANGQLVSTFYFHHMGAFPELYRYTFPKQTLIDMVYPSRGQVMRPVHVSQVSREMINRAFQTGCYLWAYDLEEENSFHNDPEMMQYLIQVVSLRKKWLADWGAGTFLDDRGISPRHPIETIAKAFDLDNGNTLLTVAHTAGGDDRRWVLDFQNARNLNVKHVTAYRLGSEHCGRSLPFTQSSPGVIRIEERAAAPLALVYIEYARDMVSNE